jgi:hypothetical protein
MSDALSELLNVTRIAQRSVRRELDARATSPLLRAADRQEYRLLQLEAPWCRVLVHAVQAGDAMKRSRVTLIPEFDLVEFAQVLDCEPPPPSATIVPKFDVEQYARAAACEERHTSGDEPHTYECAPTSRPPHMALIPIFGGQLAEGAIRAEPTSPSPELLEALLDARVIRCPMPDTSFMGPLSHRAMFLLLHVDGVSTVREIVQQSGIPREEALGALATLLRHGMVCVRDAA